MFPRTGKALLYFSDSNRQRKSIEKIRLHDDGNSPMVFPEALPDMDNLSGDRDE